MKLGQKIDLSHFIKWSGSENISSSQLKNMKDAAIEAVSTDSRTIEPGDFFIPLKGPSFDGHDFICEAVAGGCCGFVIESDKTGIYEAVVEKIGKPAVDKLVILKADDNLVFLENLAGSYLKSFPVVTIGITGSAGKTSTKDFIASILSKSFDIKYTPKNYNTEIGVSLSALEVNHSTKFFISEMGMRAKGQIRKLAEMIDPAIGVITTVGPSHLEFFNNIEEIALAKAELADFLSLKGGVLFLNGDDEWAAFIAGRTAAKIFLFGKNNRFDFNFQEYDADDFGRYSFTFFEKDRKIADIKLSSSGYQSIYNAGLAASVCTYLGAGADLVKKGLELGQTSEGRMNVFKKGDIIIINDCYNASPLSMKCAIETLNLVSGRNRSRSVALLADMFELGQDSAKLHYEIGRYLREKEIDVLVTFGKMSENICLGYAAVNGSAKSCEKNNGKRNENSKKFYHFEDIENLKKALPAIIKSRDTILIKGSRANKLEAVIECLS